MDEYLPELCLGAVALACVLIIAGLYAAERRRRRFRPSDSYQD
jgi:hypothetical protein